MIESLSQHETYIKTCRRGGVKSHIIGDDGSNINLSSKDLRWLRLTNVTVTDSKLVNTVLMGSRFNAVTFINCNFYRCSFRNTNLINVRFINCDLSNCDFSHANLNKITFTECDLSRSNFSNSFLIHLTVLQCKLHQVLLSDVVNAVDIVSEGVDFMFLYDAKNDVINKVYNGRAIVIIDRHHNWFTMNCLSKPIEWWFNQSRRDSIKYHGRASGKIYPHALKLIDKYFPDHGLKPQEWVKR